ncbi:hypothetical protein [Armatimonas rosea]|uniref:Uncharacterized protein n=1 Tax=Armatimonas rosea TaxID=685828 RepID=A0A7W9SPZ1_ARMRO|nr:hypothetical protein [Armatimonas rosea]MBB6049888.1 hypothetical protein [Armatimonas rosea]
MTLTIEKPETKARLIRFAASRGISPLEALDELLDEVEENAIPEPVITQEFADELQAMCEGIEAGTIKVAPWDSEARRKRTAELLKREFGYEAPSATKDIEKAAA